MITIRLTSMHTFYKRYLSPAIHSAGAGLGFTGSCRFQPTCSEYATLAFAQHGPITGLRLATLRLLRCNPFTQGGWDPVPPAHPPACPCGHPATRQRRAAGTIEEPHSTQDPA